MQRLGDAYYHGVAVEVDYDEAARWYRQSAELNMTPGQFGLGCCYYYGRGVDQSYAEAAVWFRKAAEKNYAPATRLLGDCCFADDDA